MWKQKVKLKPYKLSNNYQNWETTFPLSCFKATSAPKRDFFRNCLKVKSQPSKAILRHLRKRLQKIYGFKTIMSVEFRLHEDPQSTYLSQSIQLLVLPITNGLTRFSVIKSFDYGYSCETIFNILFDLIVLLAYIKVDLLKQKTDNLIFLRMR